jgi:hypothetical protein
VGKLLISGTTPSNSLHSVSEVDGPLMSSVPLIANLLIAKIKLAD